MIASEERLNKKKYIILYGAGLIGHIYQDYLQAKGFEIACYAVCNDQVAQKRFQGKEVKHISDISLEKKLYYDFNFK